MHPINFLVTHGFIITFDEFIELAGLTSDCSLKSGQRFCDFIKCDLISLINFFKNNYFYEQRKINPEVDLSSSENIKDNSHWWAVIHNSSLNILGSKANTSKVFENVWPVLSPVHSTATEYDICTFMRANCDDVTKALGALIANPGLLPFLTSSHRSLSGIAS